MKSGGEELPGWLGGVATRQAAARRITAVTVAATFFAIATAVLFRWPWRPTCAALLFAQAAGVLARLYLAYEASIAIVPAASGVLFVRYGRAEWFVAYADISATQVDGADVCITVRDGAVIRIGFDAPDGACIAVLRIKTKLSRRA